MRRGAGESKLVRCSYGAIFDVVVDLRPSSPTYRNWESFQLHGDEQVSLYVPAGCAHGFQALTEPADVSYRIDRPHDPTEDVTIAFDDPDLAISWPLQVAAVSQRDREAPSLSSVLRVPLELIRSWTGERSARLEAEHVVNEARVQQLANSAEPHVGRGDKVLIGETEFGIGAGELVHPSGDIPTQVQLWKRGRQLREVDPVVTQIRSGRGGEGDF